MLAVRLDAAASLAVGGRGYGPLFRGLRHIVLFHLLFRALGPVGGTAVLIAVLVALAFLPRMLGMRRRW